MSLKQRLYNLPSWILHPRILIFIVVATGVSFLTWTDTYQSYEQLATDFRFQLRQPEPHQTPVVHVDIDDQSINKIGRWPWNRDKHAIATRLLKEAGSRYVVYDVTFPDRQKRGVSDTFAQKYMDLVNEQFNQIVKKYKDLRDNLQQFDTEKRSKSWRDRFSMLYRKISQTEEKLIATKQETTIDYDRRFSQAIRDAGNVFIPFDKQSSRNQSSNQQLQKLRKRIQDIVNEQPDITKQELLQTLKKSSLINGEKMSKQSAQYQLIERTFQQTRTSKMFQKNFSYPLHLPAKNIQGLTPPIYPIAKYVAGSGSIATTTNNLDGKLRHQSLFFRHNERVFLQLGFAVALKMMGINPARLKYQDGSVIIPYSTDDHQSQINVPLEKDHQVLINWNYQKKWKNYMGEHISYVDVYDLYTRRLKIVNYLNELSSQGKLGVSSMIANATKLAETQKNPDKFQDLVDRIVRKYRNRITQLKTFLEENSDRPDSVLSSVRKGIKKFQQQLTKIKKARKAANRKKQEIRKRVQDKICLIGASFTSSADLKSTPVHSQLPGVALHSTIIDMVLNQDFIWRASQIWSILCIILASILGVSMSQPGSIKKGFLMVFLIAFLYAAGNFYLFESHNYLLDFTGFQLSLFLSFGGMTGYNLLFVEQERQKTLGMFETYMDPNVVDELMQNPEMVKMGGDRQRLSIFFLDISGFTSISENHEPEEVVTIISRFLSGMTDVIFDHKGTLDKYEGDAIMAYFGAPVPDEDHERHACFAALQCLTKLDELNDEFQKRGFRELDCRIGINTGDVVLGNLGSRQHADFTVMGDNVNLAARLEGANKFFGTRIMISESTYQSVKDDVDSRLLGHLQVKGKEESIPVYEVLGKHNQIIPQSPDFYDSYQQALEQITCRQWKEAEESLQKCARQEPEDPVVRLWLDRLEEYRTTPPPDGNELLITLTTK